MKTSKAMIDNRFLKYFRLSLGRVSSRYLPTMLVIGTIPISIGIIVGLINVIFAGKWAQMEEIARMSIFFASLMILIMSFPAYAFGFITAKDSGSEWALVPASKFEKFASMNLITLVAAPLVFVLLYFVSDFLMTSTGLSAGRPLVSLNVNDYVTEVHISQYLIIYLTYVGNVLFFLLGALIFKKSKVVFTILCLMALNIITGVVAGLVGVNINIEDFLKNYVATAQRFTLFVNAIFWISTVVSVGVLESLIWLRIKKITY